jgi:penicillin-binding protein 2
MASDRRASRLGVLALVGVMLFGLVGVRMWFLQTVRADELQQRVTFAKTRTVDLIPERGRIFDINGRILADNRPILNVTVDRAVIRRANDRAELFRRISGWINVPVEELERRYRSVRYSPFLPLPLREDVEEPIAIALLERVEDFPGVNVENGWQRVYPYAPHGAHVVGYMGAITAEQLSRYRALGYNMNQRVGQFGIELSMETELHGTWGRRVYEVDAANRPVRLLEEVPPINGFDIQLSIDLELQIYVEQALETSLDLRRGQPAPNPLVQRPGGSSERLAPNLPAEVPFLAPAGSAVLMNYDNGQVMAMASYPTFDNRWFEAGISGAKFRELFPITDDPDKSILVNRAIQGRYNLGSTFKPFPMFAALNNDLFGPDEIFRDTGEYKMFSVDPDRCRAGLVRCVYRNAICSGTGRPCSYGNVNPVDALAVSSDGFFYRIGEELLVYYDTPVLQEEVRRFGFGERTGIDLPFEFAGTVPDRELKRRYAELGVISVDEGRGYFAGDNVQMSIGQGLLSATPLQLANSYGAIASNGFRYRPKVVLAIYEPGVPIRDVGIADIASGRIHEWRGRRDLVQRIEIPLPIKEVLVEGLTRVVTQRGGLVSSITGNYHRATGENLFFDYPSTAIPLAGKTGTAQGRNNYPWNDSSAFVAFSLDDDRPYVMSAYLEKAGYGSQAAAPVVKCTFLALSGEIRLPEAAPSDPLDPASTAVAVPQRLRNLGCFNSRFGGGIATRE